LAHKFFAKAAPPLKAGQVLSLLALLSTKVQILTPEELRARSEATSMSTQRSSALLSAGLLKKKIDLLS
jgi:hypothetical protein